MRLGFLFPVAVAGLLGFSADRLVAIHSALTDLNAAWSQAVQSDGLLPPLMNDLAAAAEQKAAFVNLATMRELRIAAAYATYGTLPPAVFRDHQMLAAYDADQIRAQHAMISATQEVYGPLRLVAWGGLTTLQSKIEGVQSTINGQHIAYNMAAANYYRLTRSIPNRWLVYLTSWPLADQVGMFSQMSGGQIKDPTENLGNDGCAHPDFDGDCN